MRQLRLPLYVPLHLTHFLHYDNIASCCSPSHLPLCLADDLQKGLRPRRSVRMAMAHETMFYAIVQKEGLGFDKAVEEAKARMSRYNVTVRLRHVDFAVPSPSHPRCLPMALTFVLVVSLLAAEHAGLPTPGKLTPAHPLRAPDSVSDPNANRPVA